MKFFYQTMLVLSSVFLFSCHQISDRKLRCYENPLKTTDSTELYIADPFIYKAGGLYYLTGTTALPEGEGFAYYISSDLIRWKYQGLLYRKPKDHIGCYGFWAPEVKYYEGRFYMTYSCYMKDLDLLLPADLYVQLMMAIRAFDFVAQFIFTRIDPHLTTFGTP